MRLAKQLSMMTMGLLLVLPAYAQQGRDRPANVVTAPVNFEYTESRVDAVGTTEAIRKVTLYPAVAERVTAVLFSAGDNVSQGQILVELDARAERVEVQRAQIVLDDAERTVKRLKDSRQRGAIPQSELDDAITARDLAKVVLRQAEVDLEDRLVRAPFDGVIGMTDIEVGERIDTQTAIATLDQRDQLLVRFKAPEAALSMLTEGATLSLTPWREGLGQIDADIEQIDSRIDPADRTLTVKAKIDNPDDRFRPGMSFRVNLQLRGERFASIPEAALQWGATGAYIWLVDENKATRVDVQIKQRLRGRLLVDGPVPVGATLITEGVQTVREGQQIAGSEMSAQR